MAVIRWQYHIQRSPTTRQQETAGFNAGSRQTNYHPVPNQGDDPYDRPSGESTRSPATRHVKADL